MSNPLKKVYVIYTQPVDRNGGGVDGRLRDVKDRLYYHLRWDFPQQLANAGYFFHEQEEISIFNFESGEARSYYANFVGNQYYSQDDYALRNELIQEGNYVPMIVVMRDSKGNPIYQLVKSPYDSVIRDNIKTMIERWWGKK